MDSQPLKQQLNFHRAPQIALVVIHSQQELLSFSLAIVISETVDKVIISVQCEQHVPLYKAGRNNNKLLALK